jgi:hypothetical protein
MQIVSVLVRSASEQPTSQPKIKKVVYSQRSACIIRARVRRLYSSRFVPDNSESSFPQKTLPPPPDEVSQSHLQQMPSLLFFSKTPQ